MLANEYVKRREDIIATLKRNGLAASETEARRLAEGMLNTELAVQKRFEGTREANTFGFKMHNGKVAEVSNELKEKADNLMGVIKKEEDPFEVQDEKPVQQDSFIVRQNKTEEQRKVQDVPDVNAPVEKDDPLAFDITKELSSNPHPQKSVGEPLAENAAGAPQPSSPFDLGDMFKFD
ncbi:MAG: hypothetical protein ABIA93_07805 [Candidatus Woesearchaeota archaeon]